MPKQPPAYRAPGSRSDKPWARAPGTLDRRKRGRGGQRDRAEVLAAEPFCRACAAAGKRVAADVVDHIVPLASGGSDARSNKQALCHPCHDAKSVEERVAARRGADRS